MDETVLSYKPSDQTVRTWIPSNDGNNYGIAIAQFSPPVIDENLSEQERILNAMILTFVVGLEVGDVVQIIECSPSTGWIRGYVFSAGLPSNIPKLGIFPESHIVLRKYRASTNSNIQESPHGQQDSFLDPTSHTSGTDTNHIASDRIRVLDKSIDFETQESPAESLENLGPQTNVDFGYPDYISPKDQWITCRAGQKPVDKITLLPSPEYPCLETDFGAVEPVIDESACVLRDWFNNLKTCLQARNYIQYAYIKKHILGLYKCRRSLLLMHANSASTSADSAALSRQRKDMVTRIAIGNGIQTPELIVRDENTGCIMTDNMATIIRMKDLHISLDSMIKSHGINKRLNVHQVSPNTYAANADILSYHVYLEIKGTLPDIPNNTKDPLEYRFSIYSKSDGKCLSDEFVMFRDPKQGVVMPGSKAVFINYSSVDINKDNALVLRIVRISKFKESDSSPYRQPLAGGTIDIRDILSGKESPPTLGHMIKLYTAKDDSSFSTLSLDLINKTNNYEPLKTDFVYIIIQSIADEKVPFVKGAIHTERMGFSDPMNPELNERNSVYVTLDKGDFSKQLGKTFEISVMVRSNESGAVLPSAIYQGPRRAPTESFDSLVFHHEYNPKWNETLRVDIPPEQMDKYHLFFAVHPCASSSTDRSSRTVAFAFKPILRSNGSAIPDETHILPLYKYDKKVLNDPSLYLSLASSSSVDGGNSNSSAMLLKETLTITTLLVSSYHSQNVGLVKLFNWRRALSSSYNDLSSVLKDLKLINEMELVKFTIPVIDALFGIMTSNKNQTNELSRLIFDNLLYVFSHVYHERDRRYIFFRPAIDNYIETQFVNLQGRPAPHLVHCVTTLIDEVRKNPKNAEAIRQLHTTFKAFVHIFKFILKCGEIVKDGQPAVDPTNNLIPTAAEFDVSFKDLMDHVYGLMADSGDHLSTTQQFAFQKFSQVLPLMNNIYSPEELVELTIKFTDSLASKRGSVVQKKLTFILSIVRGDLFKYNSEPRDVLTEAIVRWLRNYIGWWEAGAGDLSLRTQIYNECIDIVVELLDKLQLLPESGNQTSETVWKLAELLPNLLEAYNDAAANGQVNTTVNISSNSSSSQTQSIHNGNNSVGYFSSLSHGSDVQVNSDTAMIASIFLSIFHLMSETRIAEYFLKVYEARQHEGMTKFMHQVFRMTESILRGEAYPSTWVNLNLLAQRIALKIFRSISLLMKHQFMPPAAQKFDQELWTRFFVNVMTLENAWSCKNEEWTAQRWRAAYRLELPKLLWQGGRLLKAIWKAIGTQSDKTTLVEYQLRMIPALLPYVLELTMSQHKELGESASYILFSMIKREYGFCRSIKRLESFTVDHLDKLILAMGKGDDLYRRTFMFFMCRILVKRQVNVELSQLVTEYLFNIDRFIILQLSLRSLPPGNEYEDEQWSGIYKLAKFMNVIGRTDIYLKYIHHLSIKQLNSNNFVEAGWTLKLHADLLTWSNRILDPNPELGFAAEQMECDRKEELMEQILVYFEEGKAWESAISVCKELLQYYDTGSYKYDKMSDTLKKLADMYKNITQGQRFYSEYFRVGYYGIGFPASLRNKQFIYRGLEWEKLGTFCERILNRHMDSVLLKSNAVPGPETFSADGRFLQISAVVPEPDKTQHVFAKGDLVPEAIRSYYQFNNVNRFSVSRPFRKGAKTGNEFLDLWTEKTTYTTEETFPHLLRRSEVTDSIITEYSPIENAVQAMVSKNRDLIALEKKYEKYTEPVSNCSPFSMAINGSVDAPVNGGIFMYKKAFINSNFRTEQPDKAEWVDQLEEAIDEQVIILNRCIAIHNRVAPALMRPLHDTIVSFFQKNFGAELERLGITPHYELQRNTALPSASNNNSPVKNSIKERPMSMMNLSTYTTNNSSNINTLLKGTTVKLKGRLMATSLMSSYSITAASTEDVFESTSNGATPGPRTNSKVNTSNTNLSGPNSTDSIGNSSDDQKWGRGATSSLLNKMRNNAV